MPSRLHRWLQTVFPAVIPCNVSLTGAQHLLNIMRAWSPRRERWRARLDLSMWAFRQRSRLAKALASGPGEKAGAIFQMGCLWAPPIIPGVPLFLLLDFTNMLARSDYPDWAPFRSRSEAAQWLQAEREVYSHAHKIFTASRRVRLSLLNDYGVAPEKVRVVGLGGHLGPPSHGDKPYDGRTILFVGRDFERKGGPLLLEAFGRVRSHIPDAQLVIAGPSRRGSHPGVTWLGPVSDRGRLSHLFCEAHVFAMPSWCEPFGHVFVEAMNHRLPCVGTDTGGIPDIIEDGVTGYVVGRGDGDSLTAALISVLSSASLSQAFGEAGFQKAQAQFTWEAVCAKMQSDMEACLPRAGGFSGNRRPAGPRTSEPRDRPAP
jgi:glycosyltransferase involved in cell wall biosynthesis